MSTFPALWVDMENEETIATVKETEFTQLSNEGCIGRG